MLDGFELPPIDAEGVAAMRTASFASPDLSDAVVRTEHEVPGDPPVPVRVHRADGRGRGCSPPSSPSTAAATSSAPTTWTTRCSTAGVPASGWSGSPSSTASLPRRRYPGPLEDCYAALRWTHDNADELGIDKERIGIYGLSAGGGLAAALALLARDRGEVPLAFVLLDCPMLDDRQRTPSIRADGLYVWGSGSNEFGWRSYLGDALRAPTRSRPTPRRPGPTDLAGLPPTCVVVGSIDGFRDEDIDYAQRLNQAGVPCELHVIAGLPHAYLLVPGAAAVQLAMHCMDDWLARQLAARWPRRRLHQSAPAPPERARIMASWTKEAASCPSRAEDVALPVAAPVPGVTSSAAAGGATRPRGTARGRSACG